MIRNLICSFLLFSSLPLFSQSGWFQLPRVTSYSLRSNSNTGWAVGDNGIILKTSKVGLNWIEQISNTKSALYGILFSDANNGFETGYYNDGNPWCQETEIVLSTTIYYPLKFLSLLSLPPIKISSVFNYIAGTQRVQTLIMKMICT